MRLSISNIAWDRNEDEAVAVLLKAYDVDAIDVAPSKYFPDIAAASDGDITRVRAWWAARGIEIVGMQSLLFGTTGLNLFGPPPVQQAMLAHLRDVCRIGARLGARHLVFGSPKNRDRGVFDEETALGQALPFFARLGDIAADAGVSICLEPNPERYGANFMTTTAATARVVEQLGHPAIRMQFDTGALAINGEDPETELQRCAGLVGHIHASEPDLLPLGDGGTAHRAICAALERHLPGHVVTIEMLATAAEPHLQSIERALGAARRLYREGAA